MSTGVCWILAENGTGKEPLGGVLGSGEAMAYACSLCGQTFLLPEDQPPKERVAEVWAAFNDHVRQDHPE
jgi:hypothetical protein